MRPERHSFVWIAAQWRALLVAELLVPDETARLVEAWRLAGYPLVVGASRAGDPPGSVRLGLATPAKARIGLLVGREAVVDVAPPPGLDAARRAAPPAWRTVLDTIEHIAGEHRAAIAVYGSLAWQALSGVPFVRPDSDIDLLIDAGPPAAAAELFASLAALKVTPRLDGEWRVHPGVAVNWREYAGVSQGPLDQDILVKGHGGPWLWPLSRLHDFQS